VSAGGFTRTQKRWIVGGIVFGLVVVFSSLLAALDWKEIEVDVGFRGEARRNPLLAAERTLERLGYEAESRAFARCFRSEDQTEGMQAFVEKRKPSFQGR
jgi:hypothetical protein